MIGIKSVITVTVVSLALASCGGGSVGSTTGSNPTPVASETYLNQVAVSGLTTNESVTLQDNNANPITVSANQIVTFPASWQTTNTYAVTVASQTPGVTCGTSSASGTTGIADVTVTVSCSGGTESVLYRFAGGTVDSSSPLAGLIIDVNGNMYGTTVYGGTNNKGTVFKLTANGSGGYIESVLYEFGTNGATDGSNPYYAGLIMDASGNLYGTTYNGGAYGKGTIFKLTANASGGYTETVLYSVAGGADGANPNAGLIIDANGNLYGTTGYSGSTNDSGTVFKLTANGSGGYTESVLYRFAGGTVDGSNPLASLIMDASGNLYGTTYNGGVGWAGLFTGNGTVFKLTPSTSNGVTTYQETILHSFAGGAADGSNPNAVLIIDASGNLYGTTQNGGTNNNGTVFKLIANGNGSYTESVLYSFGSGTDGANPYAGLITDASGNLYGTTNGGGTNGNGTVFKLTATGNSDYTENVLYSFGAGTDGANPLSTLITDTSGNLYGTTSGGGVNGNGTVFKIN